MTRGASAADAFELPRSDLNPFLFAEVGVEPSGVKLSVLSTLARAGLDPWTEARRMSALPRRAATEALEQLLSAAGRGAWASADTAVMAARLVTLLPTGPGFVAVLPIGGTRLRVFTSAAMAIGLATVAGALALMTWSLSAPAQPMLDKLGCMEGSSQFAAPTAGKPAQGASGAPCWRVAPP